MLKVPSELIQQAPVPAPRWAPTVVVVNNRCLGVGLSLGPMDARGFGEGLRDGVAHKEHCKHKDLPCFGALARDKTPTAASSLLCVFALSICDNYKGSSSCVSLSLR